MIHTTIGAPVEETSGTVGIYLNDHLAGARAALDLIDDIVEGSTDEELSTFLERLRTEIDQDREQLRRVMDRLDVEEHRAKQVLAGIAESTSRLKLARVGQSESMSMLLELETLSAGIWTKIRLWRSLRGTPRLREMLDGIDLDGLISRGERQLDELEEHRLVAANRALAT
jgi:hypothetical protein